MTLAETRTLQLQQCHALHRRPNSDVWAKEDEDNGPAVSVSCGDHFGGVGALMGSGAMTTRRQRSMTTLVLIKSSLQYDDDHNNDDVVVIIAAGGR